MNLKTEVEFRLLIWKNLNVIWKHFKNCIQKVQNIKFIVFFFSLNYYYSLITKFFSQMVKNHHKIWKNIRNLLKLKNCKILCNSWIYFFVFLFSSSVTFGIWFCYDFSTLVKWFPSFLKFIWNSYSKFWIFHDFFKTFAVYFLH